MRRRFEGGIADGRRMEMEPAPVSVGIDTGGSVDGPTETYLWTGAIDADGTEIWALPDDPRVAGRQDRISALRRELQYATDKALRTSDGPRP